MAATVPFSRAIHAAPRPQAAQPPAAAVERRMTVLMFDLNSLNTDDVSRALNASLAFVDQNLSDEDLVSVITVSSSVRVVSDFSSDAAGLRAALTSEALRNGALNGSVLGAQRNAGAGAGFEAIKTVCQTIGPLQQRKALMYFSGGSLPGTRSNAVDQAALNDATNTCRNGKVLVYPVDTRGLGAVTGAPGALGGAALFNGTGAAK